MIPALIWMSAFAAALSLAVCGFMVHAGPGDSPDHRSGHSGVIPTCGGVGLVAALGGAVLIWPRLTGGAALDPIWPAVLSVLWAVALLGLFDDLYDVSAKLKLGVMMILAGLLVRIIGPVGALPFGGVNMALPMVLAMAGSVLWVFVTANAVNFMDGSNGMMGVSMIMACLGLIVIATGVGAHNTLWLASALAAGLIGFLPYNFRPKAALFSGDVGALLVGFTYAAAVLWLCREVPQFSPVFIGPVLILPFLTDVIMTILVRGLRKENILKAHRQHLFQRLIDSGQGPLYVAGWYGSVTLLLAGYAVMMSLHGFHLTMTFVAAPAALLSLVWILCIQRLDKIN